MAYIPTKIFSLRQGILTIQSAQSKDAEELMPVILHTCEETDFLARGVNEFNMTLEDERRFIQEKLTCPREFFLCARLNEVMVGTLGFNSNPLSRYRHKGTFGISILRDYWSLGIGRRMIEVMLEWADANGFIKISLEVDTLNSRAIHLYKSLGFREEGLLKMDRRLKNGEFRDSCLMARFNAY